MTDAATGSKNSGAQKQTRVSGRKGNSRRVIFPGDQHTRWRRKKNADRKEEAIKKLLKGKSGNKTSHGGRSMSRGSGPATDLKTIKKYQEKKRGMVGCLSGGEVEGVDCVSSKTVKDSSTKSVPNTLKAKAGGLGHGIRKQ